VKSSTLRNVCGYPASGKITAQQRFSFDLSRSSPIFILGEIRDIQLGIFTGPLHTSFYFRIIFKLPVTQLQRLRCTNQFTMVFIHFGPCLLQWPSYNFSFRLAWSIWQNLLKYFVRSNSKWGNLRINACF